MLSEAAARTTNAIYLSMLHPSASKSNCAFLIRRGLDTESGERFPGISTIPERGGAGGLMLQNEVPEGSQFDGDLGQDEGHVDDLVLAGTHGECQQ